MDGAAHRPEITDNEIMAGKISEPFLPVELSPAALRQLPAQQAARVILLRLLEALETNRPGTLAGEDAERLHDLRVAVRRTRAALGQLRGIFAPENLAHFREEFRWLGQVTGPARDLDVYLLGFPAYQAGLPTNYRGDLAPLLALLQARRQEAHQELVRGLESRRYARLVTEWRQFLTVPAGGEPVPENAQVPTGELADARLRKLFSRVCRKGRRIDAASPPGDLHALRILCKKLRYLLEFFALLYPPKPVGRLIRTLKALQDNLGAIQDLTVQARALVRFAEELQAAGEVPARTLLAMGMLIANLERRREAERAAFTKAFAHFADKRNRAFFKRLG